MIDLNQEIIMTRKLWEVLAYYFFMAAAVLNLAISIFCWIGNKLDDLIFRKQRKEIADRIIREYLERNKK